MTTGACVIVGTLVVVGIGVGEGVRVGADVGVAVSVAAEVGLGDGVSAGAANEATTLAARDVTALGVRAGPHADKAIAIPIRSTAIEQIEILRRFIATLCLPH